MPRKKLYVELDPYIRETGSEMKKIAFEVPGLSEKERWHLYTKMDRALNPNKVDTRLVGEDGSAEDIVALPHYRDKDGNEHYHCLIFDV